MVHFVRLAGRLLVALLISGCGPTAIALPTNPTTDPTSSPTSQRSPISEATPSAAPETIAPPTQIAEPSQSPATATPSATATASPSAAATASPSAAATASPPAPTAEPTPLPAPTHWVQRVEVAGGPSAREDHTWTVNGEGSIAYLFGGRDGAGPSAELWKFDLATDSWALLQPSGDAPAARFGHTATFVPSVGLVVWSGQGASGFFDDIWAYDSATNAWQELQSLGAVPAARYGSCASLGPDGELWISHGFTDSGRFADTRSYDFTTGSWTDRTPFDSVPVERCLHDCYWAGNQLILYGGQTTGVAALGDIWAYDFATGAWTQGAAPSAPARQLYGLAHIGPRSLVFGGGSIESGFLNDSWLINGDLSLSPVTPVGSVPSARAGTTLITDPAGLLLLFGGVNDAGPLADLWELPFGAI